MANEANEASLTGWGAILEVRSSQDLWKDQHFSWHINCLEMLAVFLALKNCSIFLDFLLSIFLAQEPCACPLRQHIGGLLFKLPGGFVVTSTLQTGVPNPPVVPRVVVVSSSSLHPGGPQYTYVT